MFHRFYCTRQYCNRCNYCGTYNDSEASKNTMSVTNEEYIKQFEEKPGIISRHPSGYNERLDKKGNWQRIYNKKDIIRSA